MAMMNFRAQSTLELSVALTLVLVLLLAVFNFFAWVNQRLVMRVGDYEGTSTREGTYNPVDGTHWYGRVFAGSRHLGNQSIDVGVPPYYPTLDILNRTRYVD